MMKKTFSSRTRGPPGLGGPLDFVCPAYPIATPLVASIHILVTHVHLRKMASYAAAVNFYLQYT